MKLFKKRNIQALIYGLFMLLPFCAILGRVIYVQSNKNAYESYYGETINQVEYEPVTEVTPGEYYKFYAKNSTYYTSPAIDLYISNFDNFDSTNATQLQNITAVKDSINHIRIFNYSNQFSVVWFYYSDTQYYNIDLNNQMVTFTYKLTSFTGNGNYFTQYNEIAIFNQYSYLDNAFEYSIDRFVDENNFGNFDFFQWFSTFFLQDNAVNNLYVHFINWYMNYMLYVSLGYLIFSILMWFVNFFRSLVEKSTDLNL